MPIITCKTFYVNFVYDFISILPQPYKDVTMRQWNASGHKKKRRYCEQKMYIKGDT
jgi:hypothetical protein